MAPCEGQALLEEHPNSPPTGFHKIESAVSVETDTQSPLLKVGSGGDQSQTRKPLSNDSDSTSLSNDAQDDTQSPRLAGQCAGSDDTHNMIASQSLTHPMTSPVSWQLPNSTRGSLRDGQRGGGVRSSVGFTQVPTTSSLEPTSSTNLATHEEDAGQARRSALLAAAAAWPLFARQLIAIGAGDYEDDVAHIALTAVFGAWALLVSTAYCTSNPCPMLGGWSAPLVLLVVAALAVLGYAKDHPSDGAQLLTAAHGMLAPLAPHSPRQAPAVCILITVATWLVAAPAGGHPQVFASVTILVVGQLAVGAAHAAWAAAHEQRAADPARTAAPEHPPEKRKEHAGDRSNNYHPNSPLNTKLPRHASFAEDVDLDESGRGRRKSRVSPRSPQRENPTEQRRESTFQVQPLDGGRNSTGSAPPPRMHSDIPTHMSDHCPEGDYDPDDPGADMNTRPTGRQLGVHGQGMVRPPSFGSPGGLQAAPHRSSVSSVASSHATSYVSFVANLSRRGEGGGMGFSLAKRHSAGSQPDDDLDDAESFHNHNIGRASQSSVASDQDVITEDLRSSKRKRGHTQAAPKHPGPGGRAGVRSARSATVRTRQPQPAAPLPSHPVASPQPTSSLAALPPHPPLPPPAGLYSPAPISDSPSSVPRSPQSPRSSPSLRVPSSFTQTEQAAKEITDSTRELVKTVLDLDFNARLPYGGSAGAHKGSNLGHPTDGSQPLRNVGASTLHQLVMLFGRLSEELDAFRAQQFIVASVCEVIKCDRASIFLAEWKRKEVWTITNEGHEIRVPMEKSLAGYAALHNRVLNIKDAQNDKRFNTDVDKKTGYLTRNVLVFPICRGLDGQMQQAGKGSEPIAVIQAINKTGAPQFSTEDEGLLGLLGKQAGIHLYNAQVMGQLQIEGLRSKTLLEVSKEISEVNLDLGSMMAKIMTRARQVLLVERATIFLIDEEKQELWSALTDVETAAQLGGGKDGAEGGGGVIRVPVGVGLAGHVAVTGANLNVKDAYECEMFNPEYDRKTGFVTRSILVVPIKPPHANKVMGVIQFINKVNGEPFYDEDEDLATSFSSFVGVSLNNIILYEELREGKVVREQNKELQRLREMAEQAAESKSNFLMAMSHEIRTPMSGVIGMCELLANTNLTEEQQEMNDTIRNCGEALLAIINDVLDYGKIGSGKLELEKREFSIVAMIEETIDVIRSKTESKAITMTLNIDPDVLPQVIGDNYRLRQIIINLVGNACKFTPERGSIEVAVRPARPPSAGRPMAISIRAPEEPQQEPGCLYVRFSVKDTGIGISAEAQKRLFQPFEQAEAGTTRQYGGTGLGLAICKQLTEAMKGQIGIISELGKGTEFWFTARFGRPEHCPSLRELLLSALPPLQGITLVAFVSHPGQASILRRFCELVRVNLLNHATIEQMNDFIAKMPTEIPPKDAPVRQSAEAMPSAGPFVPNILLIDCDADDVTHDVACSIINAVFAHRKKLNPQDAATHLHVALMMNMARKIETSSTLLEQGVTAVLAKPPKQQQLIKVFLTAAAQTMGGAQQQQAGKVEEVKQTKEDMHLLVAEDNPTNQLLIRKQLKGFGIVPTICDNGQLAVDKLCEQYHDLVFMDCHMPVLDGYGASKKIRELEKEGKIGAPGRPRVTIVALTADALPQTRQVCLDHGMDDYATKPLRKAQLSAVLDKYWFKED
eukprot:TRINITY_DN9489_c0_g2_i2.p1 TRINITY_DN9489_c0_g2~~TRINITY_DN9489_c0_g2_i2.p1  ORF type:complete len:1704 (+),score=696.07 TRINITY_DN9489_c0_g2_i2:76-5112(+)